MFYYVPTIFLGFPGPQCEAGGLQEVRSVAGGLGFRGRVSKVGGSQHSGIVGSPHNKDNCNLGFYTGVPLFWEATK